MSLEPAPMRVSDADRERATDLLREHWTAGRLDGDELDARCAEALAARTDADLSYALRELPPPAPPPRPDTSAATTALILGLVGLVVFLFSMGFLAVLTLPISAVAWGMGRSARRQGLGPGATAGMVMGMAGTALSLLALAGCAVVLL
jgi:hypothetical protein